MVYAWQSASHYTSGSRLALSAASKPSLCEPACPTVASTAPAGTLPPDSSAAYPTQRAPRASPFSSTTPSSPISPSSAFAPSALSSPCSRRAPTTAALPAAAAAVPAVGHSVLHLLPLLLPFPHRLRHDAVLAVPLLALRRRLRRRDHVLDGVLHLRRHVPAARRDPNGSRGGEQRRCRRWHWRRQPGSVLRRRVADRVYPGDSRVPELHPAVRVLF